MSFRFSTSEAFIKSIPSNMMLPLVITDDEIDRIFDAIDRGIEKSIG